MKHGHSYTAINPWLCHVNGPNSCLCGLYGLWELKIYIPTLLKCHRLTSFQRLYSRSHFALILSGMSIQNGKSHHQRKYEYYNNMVLYNDHAIFWYYSIYHSSTLKRIHFWIIINQLANRVIQTRTSCITSSFFNNQWLFIVLRA